ncbi:glycerophosphodiester phosphodiesterase family protein [Aurantiacibacter poecillastricola]|uniref:glycerophosphodiester phosphodiesterase family protein n=1 Tax=Aurantiacibacter poecillastricola TaxID=3064385 RepID=UPI00273DBA69|nr:glycerophosphodiester phosphodiesterase family protein [Aurantiacibacter sp. 219JJ12-13]MDP5260292.1 glycerophosphodiester phosphodiesterase family protein [Aurantiacibacter sp. 219JJ12-13]
MTPDPAEPLAAHAYAHRGLHGAGVPENSLAAFRGAIAAGLGIECDIRKSSDGRAIVFHDAELERLTGRGGKTGACSVGELTAMALAGSEERIPTLRDTLELVGGAVPLLLELKSDDRRPIDALCRAVRRDVEGYLGPFGIMSFDPRIPAWFAAHEPDMARGLVVSEQDKRTLLDSIRRGAAVRHARPHFLALDIRDLPSRLSRRQLRKGRALFSWTVRSAQQYETALESGAAPILEGGGVAAWESGS